MNIKLDHINLTVANINESITWYKNLFGMEFKEGDLNDPQEPWAIIGKDDTMICMYENPKLTPFSKEGVPDMHKIFHFGVRISDKAKWEKIVKDNNIFVYYGGAYVYPRSLSWYIADPSGHKIEVSYTEQGLFT
ncbi:MAG: VOC family protein [Bdellovibrionota bacterium]